MKISLNWLKDYVDVNLPPEELADKLTMATAEVEDIRRMGEGLDNVVVGEILEINPHPDADRLQVAKVSVGKDKKLQIVCGAPNIEVGQKVPVAMVGAKLPSGIEIKKAALRGVQSEGMMCAEDELGLGDDHEGILVLSPEAKIGQDIREAMGLDDIVLEIDNKSLTHRADLFSHVGIAREVAAITDSRFQIPDSRFKISKDDDSQRLSVKVEDDELCTRYMVCVMEGIEIKESPQWMKARLRAVGIRPINNIVDITNYVLMEYGQPLHAFDFDKLANGKKGEIVVRRAKKGEKILALDGKEYELEESNLVIADGRKPVAIAGVMGGEETAIGKGTASIVIESANFHPASVRRTAWSLGLHSESSLRFEKGLNVGLPEEGMRRAIELTEELAGGKLVGKIYDEKSKEAEDQLQNRRKVSLDGDEVRRIAGTDEITDEKIREILSSLEFEISGKNPMEVTVPIFRGDIGILEDLVEEIARLYGYGNIAPVPVRAELKPVQHSDYLKWRKRIREIMAGAGFDEIYSYSFYGENLIKKSKLKEEDHNYFLVSPLNPDQKYLRISLLPQLCQAAEKNADNFEAVRAFEIGKVFGGDEKAVLAGAIFDKGKGRFGETPERSKIKGIVELIFAELGIEKDEFYYEASGQPAIFGRYHAKSIDVLVGGEPAGRMEILDYNDIDAKLPYAEAFELDLEKIIGRAKGNKSYQPIPLYPSVERDFAFVVGREAKYGDIAESIGKIDQLVAEVRYLSLYESEELGEGKKSLAIRVVLRSLEKTLTSEEADAVGEKITEKIKAKFGAELR